MDRKSIAILAVCGALLYLMIVLANHVFPPIPVPVAINQVEPGTNASFVSGTNDATNPAAAPPAGSAATAVSNVTGTFVVQTNVPEELLVVSNAHARYTFTSRGGGLKLVELLGYPEVITRRKNTGLAGDVVTLNAATAPPVLALLGAESLQDDGVFKLSRTAAGGVLAEKNLTNGLVLTKDFEPGSNYVISVATRIENRAARPIALPSQEWVAGTATPMDTLDNGRGETVAWYNGTNMSTEANLTTYFSTNTTKLFFLPRTPNTNYRAGSNNVFWVSAQNQYFLLATMLESNQPAAGLFVRLVNLPPPGLPELADSPLTIRVPLGLETVLLYPDSVLKPGAVVERKFNLFAGPKEYHILLAVNERFQNRLDLIAGFNGFFGWFGRVLWEWMNWLHDSLSVPFAWAIITITVVTKLVFWPLTQYSAKSMKRMQSFQPQLKALQEKYKDDQQKFGQKQMEFYRKNKINPFSGCLPMLVQLPVFWGFFRMIQSAIELRGAHFLWISDLSRPDTLFIIPGFDFPVNLLPVFMGGTMLWQSHLTPASPGMDPSQQKMMRYMPLIILVFLYNYSSALALYYTVQNLLSILQTKLIQAQTAPAAAVAPAPVAPRKKTK